MEEVSFGYLKVDREKVRIVANTYLSGSQNKNEAKTDELEITDLIRATCNLKVCDAKNAFMTRDFV